MQGSDFVGTLFDCESNPSKVTVAFTMAMNAVQKGHSATVILMAEGVQLGRPGAASGMDIGAPFEPVAELMRKYLEGGGRIAICRSCMVHNGLSDAQMDARFPIITASDVVDLLMAAKGSLQIT